GVSTSSLLFYLLSYLFCLFILPPPLLSPLFPYTTLFRSCSHVWVPRTSVGRRLLHSMSPRYKRRAASRCTRVTNRLPNTATSASDRKSTRLNSSHVSISYAVFCLKKKKEKRPARTIVGQP